MSAKMCDKCSSEQDATVAKCTECGNDTFTPIATAKALRESSLAVQSAAHGSEVPHVAVDSNIGLGRSSVYLGAIAYFLKALWLVTLSAIFGQWATSQYAAKMSEISMKLVQCGGDWSYFCDQPSIFGFWVLPAIVSFVVMLLAGFAGFEAIRRLNKAG